MFLNFCSAVWGAEAAAAGALVCVVSALALALAFGPSDCARGPSAAYSKPALIQIAARTRVDHALVLMLSPGLNCRRFFRTPSAIPVEDGCVDLESIPRHSNRVSPADCATMSRGRALRLRGVVAAHS